MNHCFVKVFPDTEVVAARAPPRIDWTLSNERQNRALQSNIGRLRLGPYDFHDVGLACALDIFEAELRRCHVDRLSFTGHRLQVDQDPH